MGVGEYLSRGGYPSMGVVVTAEWSRGSHVNKFRKRGLLRISITG